MRALLIALGILGIGLGSTLDAGAAAAGRIKKVLPHLLDRDGRHTLAPSLYERDAYQAHLRAHPELRSGLRFDVQWKGRVPGTFTVRLELRGRNRQASTALVLTTGQRKRSLFGNWSSLLLTDEAYRKFGELTAWRATLWRGDELVSEQKSFLWEP